jgi:hypothetical protein
MPLLKKAWQLKCPEHRQQWFSICVLFNNLCKYNINLVIFMGSAKIKDTFASDKNRSQWNITLY